MEDLISIGMFGLIKAVESYRPNKGTKLATFAARCIENEILMHLMKSPLSISSETDDVIKEVDLKIEKSKIYRNLDILDGREKAGVTCHGLR
ncbi:DNA-directed RNA polymerase sigma subunit (sigma70/sigma32) [Paenibacillus wynnii]|nr:DNA-directed RNA polymerase sigma subunit (sigma70/sigma32) [Paenibacillus wynnii]